MSELIDRQALLDECLNHYEVGNIEQNCTMDWICKTVRNFPAASPWHRVDEPPKYTSRYVVWCGVNWYGEGMHGDFMTANYNTVSGRWSVDCDRAINGPLIGDILYWRPIEPPKED